jgi:hypothetical protein
MRTDLAKIDNCSRSDIIGPAVHPYGAANPRSWSCGWNEIGEKPRKGNHNSKIAGRK